MLADRGSPCDQPPVHERAYWGVLKTNRFRNGCELQFESGLSLAQYILANPPSPRADRDHEPAHMAKNALMPLKRCRCDDAAAMRRS